MSEQSSRPSSGQATEHAAGQSACEALRKGVECAQAGNKLLARLHLLEAAETNSHDPDCWLWLAWVADSPAGAVHSLQRALEADPQHELAQAGLRWAKALDEYQPRDSRCDATNGDPLAAPARATSGHDAREAHAVEPTDDPAGEAAATTVWPAAADETDSDDAANDGAFQLIAEDAAAHDESAAETDTGSEGGHAGDAETETPRLAWRGWSDADADQDVHPDADQETDQDADTEEAAESGSSLWMLRLSADPQTDDTGDGDEPVAESTDDATDDATAKVTGTTDDDPAGDWPVAAEFDPVEFLEEFTADKPDTELEPAEVAEAGADAEAEEFADSPRSSGADAEPAAAEVAPEPSAAHAEDVGPELPFAAAEAFEEATEEDTLEDTEGAAPEPAGPPRVLVVDDSPTVRKLVAMTLGKRGYEVTAAGDGIEALKRIAEVRPGLILMDITMPKLGGYQLCKLVKKHKLTKHIPVVMLSGKDGMFDKMRGKLVGSADYVTKPFDPEHLTQKVEKYLPAPASAGRE